MPTYTCEKCGRLFKQKSGYTDHMEKKLDCSKTTAIPQIINNVVEKKIAEKIRNLTPYPILELTGEEAHDVPIMQSFFEDLHNLMWNRAGLNPEKALEHLTFFFAYRMIEIQADTLNLPQECRWSYIASIKNEDELFETIKTGVGSFRKNKKTKPFFKQHEIQKASIVYEIIQQVNRIPLKALQGTDTLGNIFEYMLGRGMSTMTDEGQYFTNRTICSLAFKLSYEIKQTLRRPDGSLCTFADWFCGTGGFPAAYVKGVKNILGDDVLHWKKDSSSIYCQDMNISSVTTTLLNLLILTGYPFSSDNFRNGNSFGEPITMGTSAPYKDVTIDYCFMNPPYGGDKSKGKDYKFAYSKKIKDEDGKMTTKVLVNSEILSIGIHDDDKVSAGVQLAMATLSSDGGVCAIVLPQGFFFGASKKCVELRKKIAEEYKIHYVVDIASGSFLNTGTKTSMMIFQKGVGSTNSVKFIGLDEKLLVEAYLADLRNKNYSLNYKQYLPQSAVEVEGFEMVKLGDIIEIHFGERITKKDNIGTKYPVYGGGDDTFKTDKKNREGITCKVSRFGISEFNCVQIIYGDYWLMDSGFTITAKEGRALNSYIWNWLLQNKKAVYKCGRATAQMNMDIETFKSIQIPLPSLERQQEIVQAIDIWTNLAQQEEDTLKMLEQQMMFEVKEMGRGKSRVKLGDVCEINHGKRITKKDNIGIKYPVYGGGDDTFKTDNKNREGFTCKVSRFGISEFNCVQMIYGDYWLMDSGFTVKGIEGKTTDYYINYWLLNNKSTIYGCGRATAQMNIDMNTFRQVEIPLPPLEEQKELQPHFDEIRHKHTKIAEYKAKAQKAIIKFIPSGQ